MIQPRTPPLLFYKMPVVRKDEYIGLKMQLTFGGLLNRAQHRKITDYEAANPSAAEEYDNDTASGVTAVGSGKDNSDIPEPEITKSTSKVRVEP